MRRVLIDALGLALIAAALKDRSVVQAARAGEQDWPEEIKVLDPVDPEVRAAPKSRRSLPERHQERRNLSMKMRSRR